MTHYRSVGLGRSTQILLSSYPLIQASHLPRGTASQGARQELQQQGPASWGQEQDRGRQRTRPESKARWEMGAENNLSGEQSFLPNSEVGENSLLFPE